MKLFLILWLSLAAGAWQDGPQEKSAKAFFKAMYHPYVRYDGNGRVLKAGSPLTAGHIYPKWKEAEYTMQGKGGGASFVCTVPISVEREIWTCLKDDEPGAVREMAERNLLITCRIRKGIEEWTAVIRYRIIDPASAYSNGFCGLEIDVDPNTAVPLSLWEYRNGIVVLEEKHLDGYRWIHPASTRPRRSSNFTPPEAMRILIYGDKAPKDAGLVTQNNDFSGNSDPAETAAYVPVLKLPEVWNAINRYNYYPITVL